jgi:hypothetical protein
MQSYSREDHKFYIVPLNMALAKMALNVDQEDKELDPERQVRGAKHRYLGAREQPGSRLASHDETSFTSLIGPSKSVAISLLQIRDI